MANNFKPWVDTPTAGQQVQSASVFTSDEQRVDGFKAGDPASALRVNSALRQANVVIAGLMQFCDEAKTLPNELSLLSTVTQVKNAIKASIDLLHDTTLTSAKTYTDTQIADFIETASETFATLQAVDEMAVKYNEAQTLTELEKAQARDNIDVYSTGEVDGMAVKYSGAQSLTEAQKTQARDNIGAEKTITILPTSKGGTGSATVDTTPTANSTKMVTSGGIKTALDLKTVTLNGTAKNNPAFYAPTTAGNSGWFLRSNGSGAPTWSVPDTSPQYEGMTTYDTSSLGTNFPDFTVVTCYYYSGSVRRYRWKGVVHIGGSKAASFNLITKNSIYYIASYFGIYTGTFNNMNFETWDARAEIISGSFNVGTYAPTNGYMAMTRKRGTEGIEVGRVYNTAGAYGAWALADLNDDQVLFDFDIEIW